MLATNAAGQTWSETTSAAYPSVPSTPTGVTVTPGYAQNVIAWNPANYALTYNIQRATAFGGPYTTIATGVTTTSYTDSGLITGVIYYYKVTAANATGSSSTTSPASGAPIPGTATKADNSTPLDQGSSWILGAIPTPVDNALWNGIYGSGTTSIGSGLVVNQLQLTSPSRAIAISSGTGNLTIGSGGIDMSMATQNLTISCPVILASAQTWYVASNRTLTVNGVVADGSQGFGLTAGGSGPVILSANNAISGNLTIAAPAGGLPTYKFGGNNPAGYVKLSGKVGPILANGRLDILNGAMPGTINGSGKAGLIFNLATSAQVLNFQGGSSFSMYQIGADNTSATLRQTGSGAVSFSYFGYNTVSPNAQTTFDGGVWTLGQIGQNSTGAQMSSTANILGGASVTITTPRYSHGAWNVTNGTLQFGGNVSEENGSNIPLNTSLNLNVSGTSSLLLISGSLTLGDGGSGTNSNGLIINSGTVSMTNLTVGTTTAGHADANTVALSGGKLTISGVLTSAISGTSSTVNVTTTAGSLTATIPSGQRADLAPGLIISGNLNIPSGTTISSILGTTITLSAPAISDGTAVTTTFTGGFQTNVFNWTGGQLTAATITTGVGFNGSGSNISGSTLNQTVGTLAPGDTGTAGKTTINGNYQLGAAGTLAISVGGITQASAYQTGLYDYLTISGTTNLAGNLTVSLINSYTPTNTNTFIILNSTGTLSGAFANVSFGSRIVTAGGEGTFQVNKSANTVTLSNYTANTPIQNWRFLNFGIITNSGNASDKSDPDGDGLNNLLEYAFGGNPNAVDTVAPVASINASRFLQITFPRMRADLTYTVQGSSDLASWSDLVTNPGSVGTSVTYTDTTATPPRFLRLKVSY